MLNTILQSDPHVFLFNYQMRLAEMQFFPGKDFSNLLVGIEVLLICQEFCLDQLIYFLTS